jgi:hypothetical protein
LLTTVVPALPVVALGAAVLLAAYLAAPSSNPDGTRRPHSGGRGSRS